MSQPIRLGAVSYLNAKPLVYGLAPGGAREGRAGAPPPALTVRFDVPALCAKLLADGEIDLGLVPAITYLQQPGQRIVPGVCIASDGPVASVALFTRKPIGDVARIALDTSSRTSAALTRVLCARQFHISPTFAPHAPDLESMLASADAALLIGDPALFVDHRAYGAEKIDLGAAWTELTGLPFVWAFWAGHGGGVGGEAVRRLQAARDEGVARADEVADAYCAGDPARQAIARRYLREHMKYELSPRALEGLAAYYREAAALGIVARTGPLEFF